mmetsp:Transcript_441/g.1316  ORF Transcript_441/g.1316 Transcript_441/m.1316 type:complete len:358 (+) Transcript_441:500-1573(+)
MGLWIPSCLQHSHRSLCRASLRGPITSSSIWTWPACSSSRSDWPPPRRHGNSMHLSRHYSRMPPGTGAQTIRREAVGAIRAHPRGGGMGDWSTLWWWPPLRRRALLPKPINMHGPPVTSQQAEERATKRGRRRSPSCICCGWCPPPLPAACDRHQELLPGLPIRMHPECRVVPERGGGGRWRGRPGCGGRSTSRPPPSWRACCWRATTAPSPPSASSTARGRQGRCRRQLATAPLGPLQLPLQLRQVHSGHRRETPKETPAQGGLSGHGGGRRACCRAVVAASMASRFLVARLHRPHRHRHNHRRVRRHSGSGASSGTRTPSCQSPWPGTACTRTRPLGLWPSATPATPSACWASTH